MTDHPDVPRIVKTEYVTVCTENPTYDMIAAEAEKIIAAHGVKPEEIRVKFEYYDWSPSELIFEFKRDETEEEYQKRVSYFEKDKARKIAKKKSQRERELAQLAALKAKYEGHDSNG